MHLASGFTIHHLPFGFRLHLDSRRGALQCKHTTINILATWLVRFYTKQSKTQREKTIIFISSICQIIGQWHIGGTSTIFDESVDAKRSHNHKTIRMYLFTVSLRFNKCINQQSLLRYLMRVSVDSLVKQYFTEDDATSFILLLSLMPSEYPEILVAYPLLLSTCMAPFPRLALDKAAFSLVIDAPLLAKAPVTTMLAMKQRIARLSLSERQIPLMRCLETFAR